MAKLYENIFRGKFGALYARTYDTETDTSELNGIKFVPDLYLPTKEETDFKSILTKSNLRKQQFKTMKEYKEAAKMYASAGTGVYGNKSQEQGYIRQEWARPQDSDHKFHYWAIDIETMVDLDDPNNDPKLDWKPTGSARASTAIISSIQIYDSKSKTFFIMSYKDWSNKDKFTSKHGKIIYLKYDTEEALLKSFLEILRRRNPTVMFGWNSFGYDFPYITTRIMRVLDKRDDVFYFDNNLGRWRLNTDCLNGSYVSQLSPIEMITSKEVKTTYGVREEYEWNGYFLEDYLELYTKYTYTTHTSWSLDTIAEYELGSNKVNHDEFADFGEFYRGDYKGYTYNPNKEDKDEIDKLYVELTDLDKELERRGLDV